MNSLKKGLMAATLLVSSVAANATLIDFTDGDAWGVGNGLTSPTTVEYGDLSVTLRAFRDHPNEVDYTNRDEGGCSVTGLVCQTDGVGVRDDEITWHDGGMYDGELITIEFSEAVDIDWVGFLDLFDENGGKEVAQVVATYQDGSTSGQGFEADQSTGTKGWFQATADNGIKSVIDFFTGVTKLEFFADKAGSISGPSNSDFALAAIKVTEVPEPGTLGLMGLGLLALVRARRNAK